MENKIRVVFLVRGFEPVTGKAGSRRLFHFMHMFKEGGANLLVLADAPEDGQSSDVIETEGVPIRYLCSKKDRYFYGLKYTLRALREIRKIKNERIVLYVNKRDRLGLLLHWLIAKILRVPLLHDFNGFPMVVENWYHCQWMRYGFPMILVRGLDPILQAPIEFIRKIRTRVLCAFWGFKTGRKIVFRGPIFIRTRHKGQVIFGDDVCFNGTDHSNAVGLTNSNVIDTRLGGKITVGSHTGFSSVVLSSKSEIRIGEKVFVGGNVRILDHDFHALKPEERRHPMLCGNIRTKPIVIEDECFIGTNATILKGTHLGARTIVAAGSVVFGLDVPSDSMVKGNPAVVCGHRKN